MQKRTNDNGKKLSDELGEKEAHVLLRYVAIELIIAVSIIILVIYFDILTIYNELESLFLSALPDILTVTIFIVLIKLIMDVAKVGFEKAASHYMKRHADVRMAWTMISYIIWAIVFLSIFLFVIKTPTIISATLGIIIAAFIYIMGNPIGNLIGWFIIISRRPFKIGDRISFEGPNGNITGYVVDLTLMHTVLKEFAGWMKGDTFTGRLVYAPNNMIFNTNLYNYDKYSPFIYDEVTVSITYESDHKRAEEVIKEAATEIVGKNMRDNFPEVVRLLEIKDLVGQMMEQPSTMVDFSPSSVDISVVYFCRSKLRRMMKSEVTRKVMEKIRETDDVEIAYPHMHVVGSIGKK